MEELIDNDTHNQYTWICLHAGNSTDLLEIIKQKIFATNLIRRLYSSWGVGSIQFYKLYKILRLAVLLKTPAHVCFCKLSDS